MKLEKLIVGDNLFKLPPMRDKSNDFVAKGCKRQRIIYKDTNRDPENQSKKLLTSKEFRLNKALISCYMDHWDAGDYHGSIEFSLGELNAACGNKREPRNLKEFKEEVSSLLKRLGQIQVSFQNIRGYKKSKSIIKSVEEDAQGILERMRNVIFSDPHQSLTLMDASLSFGCNPNNGRLETLVSIRGIPLEAAFMILTDTIRSIDVEEFLDPIKIRMKDNVFLITEFSSVRIKHAMHNMANSNKNITQILTSHFYQLVDAQTSPLQGKARKDIKAIWDSYKACGLITDWHWIPKGSDKYYKLEFSVSQESASSKTQILPKKKCRNIKSRKAKKSAAA